MRIPSISIAALVLAVFTVTPTRPALAQAPAPAQQTEHVPDWQTAAGGHQEFDVASIRENKDADTPPEINIPYGPEDAFHDTGGVLSTKNWPLVQLIAFAYKNSTAQREAFRASLPSWVLTTGYDIEARTENHQVTKDQMRLMVQALLADRFHLKAHYEMRDVPVFDVVQIKPGVFGPGLRSHPPGDTCSAVAPRPDLVDRSAPTTVDGGFPARCGSFANMPPTQPYLRHEGGRDLTIAQIVSTFTGMGNLGRPAIDKTGLTGTYDWVMEFIDERPGHTPPPDADGDTFQEALRKQVGWKLERATAPYRFLIVDHIERPTAN